MKSTVFFTFLFLHCSILVGQNITYKERRDLVRFETHIKNKGQIKLLRENKDVCENIAKKIKLLKTDKQVLDIKNKYEIARRSYDKLIDLIISKLNDARDPVQMVKLFRNGIPEYTSLANLSDKECNNFRKIANEKLKISDKSLLSSLVNIFSNFLPGWFQDIGIVSMDLIRDMFINKLNSYRFTPWNEL
jgi:hypothetical protein